VSATSELGIVDVDAARLDAGTGLRWGGGVEVVVGEGCRWLRREGRAARSASRAVKPSGLGDLGLLVSVGWMVIAESS